MYRWLSQRDLHLFEFTYFVTRKDVSDVKLQLELFEFPDMIVKANVHF